LTGIGAARAETLHGPCRRHKPRRKQRTEMKGYREVTSDAHFIKANGATPFLERGEQQRDLAG
jgi:hypothetical protein